MFSIYFLINMFLYIDTATPSLSPMTSNTTTEHTTATITSIFTERLDNTMTPTLNGTSMHNLREDDDETSKFYAVCSC